MSLRQSNLMACKKDLHRRVLQERVPQEPHRRVLQESYRRLLQERVLQESELKHRLSAPPGQKQRLTTQGWLGVQMYMSYTSQPDTTSYQPLSRAVFHR